MWRLSWKGQPFFIGKNTKTQYSIYKTQYSSGTVINVGNALLNRVFHLILASCILNIESWY